jgi:hypothetical protein
MKGSLCRCNLLQESLRACRLLEPVLRGEMRYGSSGIANPISIEKFGTSNFSLMILEQSSSMLDTSIIDSTIYIISGWLFARNALPLAQRLICNALALLYFCGVPGRFKRVAGIWLCLDVCSVMFICLLNYC